MEDLHSEIKAGEPMIKQLNVVINNAIAGNYKVFNLLFFHVFNIFLKKELMEEITSNIN
jgi:hypothetical protein